MENRLQALPHRANRSPGCPCPGVQEENAGGTCQRGQHPRRDGHPHQQATAFRDVPTQRRTEQHVQPSSRVSRAPGLRAPVAEADYAERCARPASGGNGTLRSRRPSANASAAVWKGRVRQGVADLLQARVLLGAVWDVAAPPWSLARVGGGHGRAVLTAVPRSGACWVAWPHGRGAVSDAARLGPTCPRQSWADAALGRAPSQREQGAAPARTTTAVLPGSRRVSRGPGWVCRVVRAGASSVPVGGVCGRLHRVPGRGRRRARQ
jgi:hypothetical protein